tara:strand:+ start:828 stop:1328 length:501 start_codon:yes stop_codon:yes gene_type:complete
MKLLFENWRQYLKEEEEYEEEEEKTYEDKLLQIFINSSGQQALELGYSLPKDEINQELLIILEEALFIFHDLMKGYRQAGKSQFRGQKPYAYELYNKFFTELEKLYLHKPPFIRPPYPHDLQIDPLIDLADNLRKKILESWTAFQPLSTKDPEYAAAVDWAGETMR